MRRPDSFLLPLLTLLTALSFGQQLLADVDADDQKKGPATRVDAGPDTALDDGDGCYTSSSSITSAE